jgi:hypothetical protein
MTPPSVKIHWHLWRRKAVAGDFNPMEKLLRTALDRLHGKTVEFI